MCVACLSKRALRAAVSPLPSSAPAVRQLRRGPFLNPTCLQLAALLASPRAPSGAPAGVLVLGALLLPETPASLAERGRTDEARAVLERLRGTKEVQEELSDITEAAKQVSEARCLVLRGAAGWRVLIGWTAGAACTS
jgi:hypothetical protein